MWVVVGWGLEVVCCGGLWGGGAWDNGARGLTCFHQRPLLIRSTPSLPTPPTQLDSAICAPQRHLLRRFVETRPRGFYGAPWPHRAILQGGNGGFSLRTRALVSTILKR